VATRRTKIFKPSPGKCQLAAKPATRRFFHLPLFTWPTGEHGPKRKRGARKPRQRGKTWKTGPLEASELPQAVAKDRACVSECEMKWKVSLEAAN